MADPNDPNNEQEPDAQAAERRKVIGNSIETVSVNMCNYVIDDNHKFNAIADVIRYMRAIDDLVTSKKLLTVSEIISDFNGELLCVAIEFIFHLRSTPEKYNT